MGIFKKILKKSMDGEDSPDELQNVKWGIASPIMLRLSGGIGSVRAFGTFSCRIGDHQKLGEEGCDLENESSVAQFKRYMTDLVISSFKDVLGAVSSSMSLEELINSTDSLSKATRVKAAPVFSEKGLELSELEVMQIVKA